LAQDRKLALRSAEKVQKGDMFREKSRLHAQVRQRQNYFAHPQSAIQ